MPPEVRAAVARWSIRTSGGTLVYALLLFAPAGRRDWAWGRVMLALLVAVMAAHPLPPVVHLAGLLAAAGLRRLPLPLGQDCQIQASAPSPAAAGEGADWGFYPPPDLAIRRKRERKPKGPAYTTAQFLCLSRDKLVLPHFIA